MAEDRRDLVVSRLIAADRAAVFDAFRDPDSLVQWFYPEPEGWTLRARLDFVVGGSYEFIVKSPNGEIIHKRGRYLEIVTDERIVFTWDSTFVSGTVVHVDLADADGGTMLRITHELLPDDWVAPHGAGWNGVLQNLQTFVARGA